MLFPGIKFKFLQWFVTLALYSISAFPLLTYSKASHSFISIKRRMLQVDLFSTAWHPVDSQCPFPFLSLTVSVDALPSLVMMTERRSATLLSASLSSKTSTFRESLLVPSISSSVSWWKNQSEWYRFHLFLTCITYCQCLSPPPPPFILSLTRSLPPLSPSPSLSIYLSPTSSLCLSLSLSLSPPLSLSLSLTPSLPHPSLSFSLSLSLSPSLSPTIDQSISFTLTCVSV